MGASQLSDLIQFIQTEGRVCPLPQYWDKLWKMLPEKNDVGLRLSPPLILAAWWYSSNTAKMARLREHIEFADKMGRLNEVDSYLRMLPLSCWHSDASNETVGREHA